MPQAGTTFMDWQQVERESRLLIDEDFSWSETPGRRRGRITSEPSRSPRSRSPRSAARSWDGERYGAAEERSGEWDEAFSAAFAADNGRRAAGAVAAESRLAAGGETGPQPAPAHSGVGAVARSAVARRDAANARRAQARARASLARSFDLSDRGAAAVASGRRALAIDGSGEERMMPATRRSRDAGLRIYERSGFSPDRAGLWAVLLGIALLIGCIAH